MDMDSDKKLLTLRHFTQFQGQKKLLTLCRFARFQGSSACLVKYIYEKYVRRAWTAIKITEIQKSLEGLIVTL